MNFFKQWGSFMMAGARYHARWELQMSMNILKSRKRLLLLLLLLLPVAIGGYVFAGDIAGAMPDIIGGKEAYNPSFYSLNIFIVSILIGLGAGLITGCIGAGGGFIIAPALMSAGVKGILAVGTDLFHIFAKAIMGSIIHRKLGNVSVPLAAVFLIGAILGATAGGVINRVLYELNPVLSDAFITTVYALMLGFLGFYAMYDFLKAKKSMAGGEDQGGGAHGGKAEGADLGGLPRKLQGVNIPPMVKFDFDFTPGGRSISWVFLVLSGALVGLAAGIMGVGGGFLTFPIFVYMLGVSSMTTVGTDIFQIVFTAGYASISQYAIYGFIFYTLAMGMLLGSCLASRSAPWSPRWCRASRFGAFTPWRSWPVSSTGSSPCRPSWVAWG
ncbi:sulfite exporter TauE/SafE family protein [Desulfosarcina cetonica]|uniref:sulfite exporter TauE/SafE family protein n=1 Tax=Desulfosarcina cetonica TaxID=90730 RepID=UPI000B0DF809|nr:sulfite exporter TauE/SafE family protein [Desulfosarcina cetonica]